MTIRKRIALLKSRRLSLDLDCVYDGGSIHTLKQTEALRAAGHELDAFTRADDHKEHNPATVAPGYRVWRVGFQPSANPDIFCRDLQEGYSYVQGVLTSPGFAAAEFDVIQIHHWTSGVGLLEHIPESMPVVFTPHLLPTEKALTNGLDLPSEVADVERKLLMRADLTIALSQAEKESCIRLGSRRVELVPNGVSAKFFELPPRPRPSLGKKVRLGTVGRICRQKGTDVLLEAVEQLIKAGIDVQLDIVGSSYAEDRFEAAIERSVAGPLLAKRVTLLGPVPHTILPSIIANWDIYLQPSAYESQGIALLEAMAASRIVIAANVPAVAEYLSPDNGFLVDTPLNAAGIANSVQSAITSPIWEELALAARETARKFTWLKATSQLSDLIDSVASVPSWSVRNVNLEISAEHQKTASEIAEKICETRPATALLIGSAARGHSRLGSDIDLLFLRNGTQIASQEWHFSQGTPVDIRTVSTERIFELCEMSKEEFAVAICDDPLPDYLFGAKKLTGITESLEGAIERLLVRRFEREVKEMVAARMIKKSEAAFASAAEAVRWEAPADAQLKINAGAQTLLQATLVRENWVIQGAKRRPEAAIAYAQRSSAVSKALSFLTSAVGIDGITISKASRLISARTKLRTEHLLCLERLRAESEMLAVARSHALGSTDYYSGAISNGYIKGCINHMRSLSGIPLLPETYAELLQFDSDFPAKSFLESLEVCSLVKTLWLTVVDPHSKATLATFAERGMVHANSLSAA